MFYNQGGNFLQKSGLLFCVYAFRSERAYIHIKKRKRSCSISFSSHIKNQALFSLAFLNT